MEKLTYNNVVEKLSIIHTNHGVEYIASENYDGKIDFQTKSCDKRYWKENGYTKEEISDMAEMYREANKQLSSWKKGVRKLIKFAKKGQGTIDQMANSYTGNGPKDNIDYFWKLYKTISNENIIKMGEDKNSFPIITSYVDGSFDYQMK